MNDVRKLLDFLPPRYACLDFSPLFVWTSYMGTLCVNNNPIFLLRKEVSGNNRNSTIQHVLPSVHSDRFADVCWL